MPTRDFNEERRIQMMREETEKLFAKWDPELKAHYMKNPLLKFLWTASPKEIVAYRRRWLKEQDLADS